MGAFGLVPRTMLPRPLADPPSPPLLGRSCDQPSPGISPHDDAMVTVRPLIGGDLLIGSASEAIGAQLLGTSVGHHLYWSSGSPAQGRGGLPSRREKGNFSWRTTSVSAQLGPTKRARAIDLCLPGGALGVP